MVVRAVELTDRVCWDALARGETGAFVREAAICAELWEFGVCAGLLEDDWTSDVKGVRVATSRVVGTSPAAPARVDDWEEQGKGRVQ